MRETYQYLPHKSSRLMSIRDKPMFEPRSTANRRWSMALSSVGSLSDPPGKQECILNISLKSFSALTLIAI